MNKTILWIGIALFLLATPVLAACFCEIEGFTKFAGQVVTVGCYCDDNTQKSSAYSLTWYNTTGNVKESDTGTTPNLINTYFYESYTLPSSPDTGIWSVNLSVDLLYQTDETFNVSDDASTTIMYLEGESYDELVDLGAIVSGQVKLTHITYGYIANAECSVSVLNQERIPFDELTMTSKGGDGHILAIFDTSEWNRNTCCTNDMEGRQLAYYVECSCYPDCDASIDGVGCCVMQNGSLVTDYLTVNSEIPFTIEDNKTPMSDLDKISIALLVVLYFSILFAIGKTWDLNIFNAEDSEQGRRNNIMKVFLTLIGLWALLIPLQFINLIVYYAFASSDFVDIFETLYTVHLNIDYAVTAFMLVYFLYNILLYLGVDVVKTFRRQS